MNEYKFRGINSAIFVLFSSFSESALKRKEFAPLGVNFFLLEGNHPGKQIESHKSCSPLYKMAGKKT